MHRTRRGGITLVAVFLTLAAAAPAWAAPARGIAVKTPAAGSPLQAAVKDLERREGLLPVFLDRRGGRVLLLLTPDRTGLCGEFLYQVYMRSGLGSTPVGVDRANPSRTEVIDFKRRGGKVVAELQNLRFRASGGSDDETRAVRDSFPPSTIWSGPIAAEAANGSVLVDISSFLARDAFGVAEALKDAKEGVFKLSAELSYPDLDGVEVFPANLEFDAHETFVSDDPGPQMRGIAPDPRSVTAVEHHSLIKLPEPGFEPREADPRTGGFSELIADYGAPLSGSTIVRLAHRFRLEKTFPDQARSPVKKPIVFYVDRAAPEPIRGALLEGARWWSQAFDAAGLVDAFKVEVLPEGVSPLDARYNVINWVHRQTRGWSYGANIIDPRTGEIVKGSVLLGSLRVRQDRMIFEGLLGADATGTGGRNDPIQVSLARLRQLAVHETGHALGLGHNFAGSTFDDRASVMDYPPPRVKILDGALDLSDAYQVGVGSWDRFAIKWLYTPEPPGQAGRDALNAIVKDGYAGGLRYVSDEDSRPTGAAQPWGALWDDGADPVDGLRHVLDVRRIALQSFGLRNIPKGAPVSDLRRAIVPIYLFHRYEVDAAAKLVGGLYFNYALRGDPTERATPAPPEQQRRALKAVLETLSPRTLTLPEPLIALLSQGRDSPKDPAFDIEVFGRAQAPGFDLGAAADAASDIVLGDLLNPDRLNRVADQGGRDPAQLQLSELLQTILDQVYAPASPDPAGLSELRRRIQARTIVRMAAALQESTLSPSSAAALKAALEGLARRLSATVWSDPADGAQARYYADLILNPNRDGLAAIAAADQRRAQGPPPGMPIGEDEEWGEGCWFCEGVQRIPGRAPGAGIGAARQ